MTNRNLNSARKHRMDEFYTSLSEIEAELSYYSDCFAGKAVYCNCDDPLYSSFFQYFHDHYEDLGLRRLFCTYYVPEGSKEDCVLIEYDGCHRKSAWLEGNGDFRSKECVDILKRSDIVVTNPPFSLFWEWICQLMEYHKKFLLLGSVNAVTYKEVFPLIRDDLIWVGYRFNKTMDFRIPDFYEIKGNGYIDQDGWKHGLVSSMCWFTNLPVTRRKVPMPLSKRYFPVLYPKYDNFDAINVDRVADIPSDYEGIMGVPITFLDKYCPEQFEILGITSRQYSPEYCIKRYEKTD